MRTGFGWYLPLHPKVSAPKSFSLNKCISLNKYPLGKFLISIFQHSELFSSRVGAWDVKDPVARPGSTQEEQKSQSATATCQKNISKAELFFCLFLMFFLEDKGLKVFSVCVETLFLPCESKPLDFILAVITVFVK